MFCNTLSFREISFKTYFFEKKKSPKSEQRIRKVYIFATF